MAFAAEKVKVATVSSQLVQVRPNRVKRGTPLVAVPNRGDTVYFVVDFTHQPVSTFLALLGLSFVGEDLWYSALYPTSRILGG